MTLNRGDVILVNFGNQIGSVQSGSRPAVVCQNNIGNAHSSTTIVAPLTSRMCKAKLPTHVYLSAGDGGVRVESTILTEQIQTISKQQIKGKIGTISPKSLSMLNAAIMVSLAL